MSNGGKGVSVASNKGHDRSSSKYIQAVPERTVVTHENLVDYKVSELPQL